MIKKVVIIQIMLLKLNYDIILVLVTGGVTWFLPTPEMLISIWQIID